MENSATVNVSKVTWSLQEDVVYNNLALVLYATGCKWNCKGCYNQELWDFNHPDKEALSSERVIKYITKRTEHIPPTDITIVGIGGDFWFQLDNWDIFTQEVKAAHPEVCIIWFTGAELELKDRPHSSIDAILWGQLKPRDGKVYKTITHSETNHEKQGELFINDYDSSFEHTTATDTTTEGLTGVLSGYAAEVGTTTTIPEEACYA